MTQISANELRVGNWIQTPVRKKAMQANIKVIRMLQTRPNVFEAIQITPEWLDRFGFEKCLLDDITYYNLQLTANCDYNLAIGCDTKNEFIEVRLYPYGKHFRYRFVHQLQNLYHAITGTELILKK